MNKSLEYVASIGVNSNVLKNIVLDIRPMKIVEQSRELAALKNFDEGFREDRYKCFKLYFIL